MVNIQNPDQHLEIENGRHVLPSIEQTYPQLAAARAESRNQLHALELPLATTSEARTQKSVPTMQRHEIPRTLETPRPLLMPHLHRPTGLQSGETPVVEGMAATGLGLAGAQLAVSSGLSAASLTVPTLLTLGNQGALSSALLKTTGILGGAPLLGAGAGYLIGKKLGHPISGTLTGAGVASALGFSILGTTTIGSILPIAGAATLIGAGAYGAYRGIRGLFRR